MSDSKTPPAAKPPVPEVTTWITAPPISAVTAAEAARIATQLLPATAPADAAAAGTRGGPFGPNGAAAGFPAYVYRSAGPPLGLMALEVGDTATLHYLGLTSAAEGIGVMVEHALNLTQEAGFLVQALRVVPTRDFVVKFLELGFLSGSQGLQLRPAGTPGWDLVGTRWHRVRRRDMAMPGINYWPGSGTNNWTISSNYYEHGVELVPLPTYGS